MPVSVMKSISLQKCKNGGNLEGCEIRNTVIITFAFQAVFTAFNALKNLHSSLHDEESLGMVCLSVIYGTSIASSVFSPTIIDLVGAKLVLVFAFMAHCLYILANFYPSFAAMVPAAFVLGLFEGPAWTSQSLYIASCAFSFSKKSSDSPYTVLSRFNIFFVAIFATTHIVGNLVTSLVIRDGISNTTEHVLSYTYCGRDDCPANENATEIQDPEDWVIDITLGFYMACALVGLCLVIFLLNALPRSEWSQTVSIRTTAISAFNVLMTVDMILLVPFIIFTAMENALLLGAFTRSYVACPIGIHMVGFVMAVYGVSTPVFLLIFTQVGRVTGRFIMILLALGIHLALLIVLYDWVPTNEDEATIFIIPIVWGVAESILQAQANSLIAILFSDKKEPAFANFHAWRNLGYTITFMNVGYICVSTKIVIAMICLLVGAVLYTVVEIKTKIQEKRALKQPREPEKECTSDPTDTEQVEMRKISSMGSHMSIQDRLSFEQTTLADVINEAKDGWDRDGDHLKLQLRKVMSREHLRDSKATTWYHKGPGLAGITDATLARLSDPGFLRLSLSETNLSSRPQSLQRPVSEVKYKGEKQLSPMHALCLETSRKNYSRSLRPTSPGVSSVPGDVFDFSSAPQSPRNGDVKFIIGGSTGRASLCGSIGQQSLGGSTGRYSLGGSTGRNSLGGSTGRYSSDWSTGCESLGGSTGRESYTSTDRSSLYYGSENGEMIQGTGTECTVIVTPPTDNEGKFYFNHSYEHDEDKATKRETRNKKKRKSKQKPKLDVTEITSLSEFTGIENGHLNTCSEKTPPLVSLEDTPKTLLEKPSIRHKILSKLAGKRNLSNCDLNKLRRGSLVQSLPANRSLSDIPKQIDDPDDSDGFVDDDDDDMHAESTNGYFDGVVYNNNTSKKKKILPKMECEDVDCIY